MAASRRGRVIFIDSPGSYYGILEEDVHFNVGYVHLYTDGEHSARLTIYAGQEPKAEYLLFDSGDLPGEDWQCDWSRGHSEETSPDSTKGITVILSGEGSRALVYRT